MMESFPHSLLLAVFRSLKPTVCCVVHLDSQASQRAAKLAFTFLPLILGESLRLASRFSSPDLAVSHSSSACFVCFSDKPKCHPMFAGVLSGCIRALTNARAEASLGGWNAVPLIRVCVFALHSCWTHTAWTSLRWW